MSSAINILHNCSKASENRQILCELRAQERIAPFLKAEDMEVVVSAILTLSYISSDDQKKLLEAETKVRVMRLLLLFVCCCSTVLTYRAG